VSHVLFGSVDNDIDRDGEFLSPFIWRVMNSFVFRLGGGLVMMVKG